MFLANPSVQVNTKIIRGVQYNVFSIYYGPEFIYDRIGKMIEDAFETTDAVEITESSLSENDIAMESD